MNAAFPQFGTNRHCASPRCGFTGFERFDLQGDALRAAHHPQTGKPLESQVRKDVLTRLGKAGLFISGALLLRKLPPRLPQDGLKTILPADWKVWGKVILGILTVQNLNKALDWKPPPWLGALQAVSVINPLVMGLSKTSLKQTAVMAPIVAGVVQGAHGLQKLVAEPAQEKWDIPPAVTRLGLSLGLGVVALLTYPKLYQKIAATGIIGKELKEQAAASGSAFATATFASCVRGCSPGSFICLSEMADILGSFTTWFRAHAPEKASEGSRSSAQAPELASPKSAEPPSLRQRQQPESLPALSSVS